MSSKENWPSFKCNQAILLVHESGDSSCSKSCSLSNYQHSCMAGGGCGGGGETNSRENDERANAWFRLKLVKSSKVSCLPWL